MKLCLHDIISLRSKRPGFCILQGENNQSYFAQTSHVFSIWQVSLRTCFRGARHFFHTHQAKQSFSPALPDHRPAQTRCRSLGTALSRPERTSLRNSWAQQDSREPPEPPAVRCAVGSGTPPRRCGVVGPPGAWRASPAEGVLAHCHEQPAISRVADGRLTNRHASSRSLRPVVALACLASSTRRSLKVCSVSS